MDNTYVTAIIAKILTAIGALNWGLVGLFDFDLVAYLLGERSGLSRSVYVIVGLSSFVVLSSLFQNSSKSIEVVDQNF